MVGEIKRFNELDTGCNFIFKGEKYVKTPTFTIYFESEDSGTGTDERHANAVCYDGCTMYIEYLALVKVIE